MCINPSSLLYFLSYLDTAPPYPMWTCRSARSLPQHCVAESLCNSTLPNGLNVSSHSPSPLDDSRTHMIYGHPSPTPCQSHQLCHLSPGRQITASSLKSPTQPSMYLKSDSYILLRKMVRNNLSTVMVNNLGKRSSLKKKIEKIVKDP